jgi:hypothetical protein
VLSCPGCVSLDLAAKNHARRSTARSWRSFSISPPGSPHWPAPALKASDACFLRARPHSAGPQRPPCSGTARKAIFAFSAASIFRVLRRNGSDPSWLILLPVPNSAGTSQRAADSLSQVSVASPILVRYLFSCTYGSGFGLKGVISSSSRQTTRFLNFQPCAVFTNISS